MTGFQVVENATLVDVEHVGHWIAWYHPLVRWLARWLRLRPYDVWPIYERRPKRDVFRLGNMLVMHPEVARQMRRELAVEVSFL